MALKDNPTAKKQADAFRSAPDPEADAAPSPPAADLPTPHIDPKDDVRIGKSVRMRRSFSDLLYRESVRRTLDTGRKVSEADVLEEALAEWKKKHKL